MSLTQLAVFAALIASVASYGFPDCTSAPLKGNAVCDTSKDSITRATALVNLFTIPELIDNTGNDSPGVPRLGLPAYQWWSEALHGVAYSPGVTFNPSGEFSAATSFPLTNVLGSTFDDELIKQVGDIISTEARAFNNVGQAGLNFWTPNINPYKDPRWGRGQETPGEDPFHISRYVLNFIQGLQGGVDPEPYFKIAANCKHFAAYDVENWEGNVRDGFNAVVSQQDLSEYYLPPFQTCVRDAKVASVMCAFNAVNGLPSCASPFLLQTVLKDHWGFTDDRWVTGDCGAVADVFTPHNFTATPAEAAAVSLKAGTDIDCGTMYGDNLMEAFNKSMITEAHLRKALIRQYASFVRLGYFDDASKQPLRQLGWKDVNTTSAQVLAHKAAVEGIVLLKNDGILPLQRSVKKIALIGLYAGARYRMQGIYFGAPPLLIGPLEAAQAAGFEVIYAPGTNESTTDTSGFAAAVDAAKSADVVIFAGGLSEEIEREAIDRTSITWSGNQLDLINELEKVGKPLVVVQFGGGQVDQSSLKTSKSVNAILWAGYPGQSGGAALFDLLTGKAAPAGRLGTTQYPAEYVNQVPMTDMTLRPSATNPGRTYKWYTGTPVFEFGFGLHYTTFSHSVSGRSSRTFSIQSLVMKAGSAAHIDLGTLDTFSVRVKNTGNFASDYVALLFVSSKNGPAPHPNKELVSYTRLHDIAPGRSATANLEVTLGAISRADENGDKWLFPGTYTLTVDTSAALKLSFTLTGSAVKIADWPRDTSASST